ncbi:MAG: OmpA family protein [Chlorobi bacterium]|nr:OmpA family protein [Chlorobiota bacterium]
MRNILLILVVVSTGFYQAWGQEQNDNSIKGSVSRVAKKGIVYIFDHNEPPALELFDQLWQKDSTKPIVRFGWAISHIAGGGNKEKAVIILEELQNDKFIKKRKYAYWYWYYLGRGYHSLFQLDNAEESYNEALQKARKPSQKARINRWLQYLQNTYQLIKDSVYKDVYVFNMLEPINSSYREYASVVPKNETKIYYTARRPGNIGGKRAPTGQKDPFGFFYEDIWVIDYTGETPEVFLDSSLSTEQHDATAYISPDGKYAIIYISDGKRFGDLYETRLTDTGWTPPSLLSINTKWLETSAFISPDGKELYFTSNKPGGEGARDIYVSVKQSDGTWGEPRNLGPTINSPHDEEGLYITPDGKYLFFASNSPTRSMGGYDIFRAERQSDGTWGNVINLGPTVNTPDNDIYFYTSKYGYRAFITSDRKDGVGTQDLYVIATPNWFYTSPALTTMRGRTTFNGKPVPTRLELKDLTTGEIIMTTYSDPNTGEYSISVPMEGNFELIGIYQGFMTPMGRLSVQREYNNTITNAIPYITTFPDLDWKTSADSNYILPMHQWYVSGERDTFVSRWDDKWRNYASKHSSWLWSYEDTLTPIAWNPLIDSTSFIPFEQKPWSLFGGKPMQFTELSVVTDSFSGWAHGKQLPEYLLDKYAKKEKEIPIPAVPDSFVVYFNHDDATVSKTFKDSLLKWLVPWVQYFSDIQDTLTVTVFGYACDLGPTTYNLEISRKRAENVAKIILDSVKSVRVIAEGKGELKPEKPTGEFRKPLHKAVVKIILPTEIQKVESTIPQDKSRE